jgi:hypothetical protein
VVLPANFRVDAWVTPPAYTGKPPIILKSGNRVRITAQLIDAEDGTHRWAERYDRAIDDIFAIQDEITLVLATEMQVKLTEGEAARLHYTTTTNVQYIPFRGYPLHYLCPGGTVSQCSSSTANRGRVGDLHYYGEEINAARVHCYRV